MYVIYNCTEKDGDRLYNTACLIDRDGKLAGKYRKVHLAPIEHWFLSSGDDFPVFSTDIGNVGIAICYDMVFPESCRILALKGADIIFHPTNGMEGQLGVSLLRVRAVDNSVILAAACKESLHSCIISNNGEILAEKLEGIKDQVVLADVNADYDRMQDPYYHNSAVTGISSIRARYAFERRPSAYDVISEERFPLLERYGIYERPDIPGRVQYLKQEVEKNRKAGKLHW
jgi:apolipoprotein N-acyltransferase